MDQTDRAMTLRLPASLHDQLKEQAQREDRSMAQLLRLSARLYLERQDDGSGVPQMA